MKNPLQKPVVNKFNVQKANNENGHIDENGEIFNPLNSVYTNELEYSLHTHENPHLLHDSSAQKQSRLETSLPPEVPLQHVHHFKPHWTLNYHALNHPKHMKIIDTYKHNRCQKVAKSSEFTGRKRQWYHISENISLHAPLIPGTKIFHSHCAEDYIKIIEPFSVEKNITNSHTTWLA